MSRIFALGAPELPPTPYPQLLAASLALLTVSEASKFYPGSACFKIIASLAFVGGGIALAPSPGAWADPLNRYPAAIAVGLVSSLVGDILLIPGRKSYHEPVGQSAPADPGARFKAGTAFFALAHAAYIAAFLSPASATTFRLPDFAVALATGLALTYKLGFLGGRTEAGENPLMRVPADMKGLVGGYALIIVGMVATAAATDKGLQRTVGAVMFMCSDLYVAMDVFGAEGKTGWKARAVGWMAYFWAQMLLAGCLASP